MVFHISTCVQAAELWLTTITAESLASCWSENMSCELIRRNPKSMKSQDCRWRVVFTILLEQWWNGCKYKYWPLLEYNNEHLNFLLLDSSISLHFVLLTSVTSYSADCSRAKMVQQVLKNDPDYLLLLQKCWILDLINDQVDNLLAHSIQCRQTCTEYI